MDGHNTIEEILKEMKEAENDDSESEILAEEQPAPLPTSAEKIKKPRTRGTKTSERQFYRRFLSERQL